MDNRLIFKKLKRQEIFNDTFLDFTENNTIEFKKVSNSRIAVLYGPNGTGKTSLAKTLDKEINEIDMEFEIEYKNNIYTKENCDIFHIINDQNDRNIIKGDASDYLIGENIKKECELKKYLDKEFTNLFVEKLSKGLKEKFGISSSKNGIIRYIDDLEIQRFIIELSNRQSKGNRIDRGEFINKIERISIINDVEYKYDEAKYKFIIENITDNKSIIFKLLDIKRINLNHNIKKIEETSVAINILDKFDYKHECIVCDSMLDDREGLIEKKKNEKKSFIESLDKETKKILDEIISLVDKKNYDPFQIKNTLYNAITNGNIDDVNLLIGEIKGLIEIIKYDIYHLFKVCLDGSDISEKYYEYRNILKEQPQITDDELLFIKQIVSENIGKDIELKRDKDDGSRFRLFLSGQSLLDMKDRSDFKLSNGEQNFISLSFELLKAKRSNSEIIILDDPISSFDSIYKNKIAFAIIKFLENKNVLVLTHNTDLIRLLEFQLKNCFNLYIYNNNEDANNGFIYVSKEEKEIFLNIDKLINLFRKEIVTYIKDERLFLMSMVPFMRGYANIIGDSFSYTKLSKIMHGYEDEVVNITQIYNDIFGDGNCIREFALDIYNNGFEGRDLTKVYKNIKDNKELLFKTQYEASSKNLIDEELSDIEIIDKDKYPLLNKTLIHTLTYLILRLSVEKVLVEKYSISIKKNPPLQELISKAFNIKSEDSYEIQHKKINQRVFLISRKTLLNEFNHFEGNMNIFQPAIDITDEALKKEKDKIKSFLNDIVKL